MGKTRTLWIVGLLVLCNSLGSAAEWRVGMARTDVTPARPLWMAGYAARKHPAEGTLHPLWAKALAIEDQRGQRVVIVTLDLIGDNFGRETSDGVGKRVQRATGIERERMVFNFSHTHSGPVTRVNDGALVTYPLNDQHQADVRAYTQTLEDKLVKLIENACENMRPADLAYGVGEVTFAANRRTRYNPDGPVDHTMPVLRVNDENGRLLAALFGYACHTATLVGDFYQFNGDYAGFAQIAFEASHPGAMAMFMMGCGGDINPSRRGEVRLAEQHGKSLANAVDELCSGNLHRIRSPLTVAFERVDLPFVDPPTQEELEKRRGQGNVYDQRLTEVLLKRIAIKGSLETSYACPVQVVRFGDDLSLVVLSGETVVDYALRLRKEFSGQRLWVAGYSNEVFAYLPSERVLAEGGYEAAGAMKYFGFHGPFKPGVEDRVVGLVRRLMEP
ncbi:MAG: neutral/alkaline non-lysosomal ceramidase N-terminal domain-containing protein [Planctomycetes bacterium]|nr:neutral/alkaline non-lysosomal ceramidase N-terminal domain-containing protein [Planctomycetota bacterium]MBL7039076.1 neutral/alkaline non-lysosomal ceramidase N-terminal domain-containing protein [Pirellulaceae bacterium]